MYEEFFGLTGAPFKLNPDPKFFFGSRSHNKAMAYLHYGLKQAEGFIVITGPVGTGKSMLIGHLLDQLNRSNVVAAHLLTSNVEPSELLSHILSAFRIVPEGQGRSGELEAFEDYLFDQLNRGRRVLLILDEAQNLPHNTLEELRMLSNIDYDGTPLFQVFLVGQPEFRGTLAADNMEQLKQRVIASYHLEDLSQDETREYIEHRLSVVGWKNDPAFTDEAFELIHGETRGRPRRINTVCNRVMLYCSIEKRHIVDGDVVRTVLDELAEEQLQAGPSPLETAPKKPASGEKSKTKSAKEEKKKDVVVPFQAPADATDSADSKVARGVKEVDMSETEVKSKEAPRADQKPEPTAAKEASASAPKEPAALKETKGASAEKATTAEKAQSTEKTQPTDKDVKGAKAKQETPAAKPAAKVEKKPDVVETKKAAAPAAAPVSVEAGGSVLDRIRQSRTNAEAKSSETTEPPSSEDAPTAATLKDVASAIAAASSADADETTATDQEPDQDETNASATDDVADLPPPANDKTPTPPSVASDPKGWRRSVVSSINDTRDELRAAHSSVARLRRQLADIDRRRNHNRAKIEASLSRAATLLTEIRDAWR